MKHKLLNTAPDLTLFGAIILALLLGKLFPDIQIIPAPATSILGVALIAGGMGLGIAVLAFIIRRGGSTDVVRTSDTLITKKYFALSRNPLYVTELAVVTGVAVLSGSLAAFVGPAVYFLILNFAVIPYEEQKLEKAFGKTYVRYKKSVRRWL